MTIETKYNINDTVYTITCEHINTDKIESISYYNGDIVYSVAGAASGYRECDIYKTKEEARKFLLDKVTKEYNNRINKIREL